MTLRVVGAGLGRTGTMSLKLALERLLGAPCHHMMEVFTHPEQVPVFHDAARGSMPDWKQLLAEYRATVDFPACCFWPELAEAFPDALVLLSVRESAAVWWASASRTIFEAVKIPVDADTPLGAQRAMTDDVFASRFTSEYLDADAAMAAYERHNDAVRTGVPADRLLEWQPGDGWEPICERLELPVPDDAFPRVNSTAEFRQMFGLDLV